MILEDFRAELEVTSRNTLEWMLGAPTRVRRAFAMVPCMPPDISLTCMVQSGNYRLAAEIFVQLEEGELDKLIPSEPDADMRLDMVGEITNTIAGCFFGRDRFVKRFGSMIGGLPKLIKGNADIADASCVGGIIEINGVKIFIGTTLTNAGADAGTEVVTQ